MIYDLTSFLTTIAAASASIVAILGGFIASKLISLSSERSATTERLKQITEELDVRISEKNRIQAENDIVDALDFIRKHITDLMYNKNIDDIYDESEQPILQKDVLSVYWEKAKNVYNRFFSAFKEKESQLNGDDVPTVLAREYATDNFSYEVCREIAAELKRQQKSADRAKRNANNFLGFSWDYPDIFENITEQATVVSGYWYDENVKLVNRQQSEIMILELQKKQIEKQLHLLRKPKGMRLGLGIFAIFSGLCIILPLAFTPFTTENIRYYSMVKIGFLCFFSLGLIAIFLYLVYLLKWDDEKK